VVPPCDPGSDGAHSRPLAVSVAVKHRRRRFRPHRVSYRGGTRDDHARRGCRQGEKDARPPPARSPERRPGRRRGVQGLFYHFVALADGTRAWNCELSTIDTALLMAGVLIAESYFDRETEIESSIRGPPIRSIAAWTGPGLPMDGPASCSAGRRNTGGPEQLARVQRGDDHVCSRARFTHPPGEPRVWSYWTSTYVWGKYYDRDFVSFGPSSATSTPRAGSTTGGYRISI